MRTSVLNILLLLFVNIIVTAQYSGVIRGKVTDFTTKQAIPLATVQLVDESRGTTTDEDGNFSISGLLPKNYIIKITAIGYSAITKSDIPVNNSKPVQVDFALQEEILQLSGVTVTSDYFDKNPAQFNSTASFSYEEIRRSPGGFEDVIRALSVLPGVAQADAGRNDLIVRGGAPSENLYIVDGIEIPNINHFGTQGASGGPLSYINLDFVKETSFSTGGFPVLYGDRLSSVLSIKLREGRNDKIGGKATISASQFGLNLEGPVSKKSNFIFSARRSYLDFIFKAAGFGFVPEYYDFFAKYDVDMDVNNKVSFITVSALDNVRYFNETPEKRFKNSRILGSDQVQYFSGLTWQHLIKDGYFRFVLSRNYTDYNTTQKDSLLNPIFKNISLESENRLRVDYTKKFANHFEINTGGDINLTTFEAEVKLPTFFTSFGEKLPYNELQLKSNFVKYALFSNLSYLWKEVLATNFGVRADYFNGIDEKLHFSPRFSVSYLASNLLSFSFSTGLYQQSPSYIWLAAGNRNLKPVKMLQYIVGTEYKFRDDAIGKVEVYYKKYSDYPASLLRNYLTLANTGAGYAGAEDNFASFGFEPLISGGKGVARGIEFSAQKKLSSIPCFGIVSLTYNKSEFTALDNKARAGAYDQTWIFNFSGGYQFNESFEAAIKFRYASGRPYTPYNNDGTQSVGNYNSERLPDLHSLDVRIDKKWFFETMTLITYIDIQNIYGRKNISAYRWNSSEKKIEANSGIGILPSIGVSLEF
ncbi:MAG: TonB-dependent receptor [Ignavibacteriales bacterium]|nr:TonB-dependent receptor [Ignavibacteriales bacterium]